MPPSDLTPANAVADADLRVLLMSVFHLTGDRRWLAPPFAPMRDVKLIADEDAGLSAGAAAELRAAAAHLLATGHPPPAIGDPGDELMAEMMSVCLGQTVAPEYAPMMREEMGFVTKDVAWRPAVAARDTSEPTVLIVGAGASGIALGAQLGRLGVPYRVVEKRSSLGGVWRDNRYPGAGVDTPNHAYSFSFTPPNNWSRFFAPQPEIEDYLQRAADACGVTANVDFNTEVLGAIWHADEHRWHVTVKGPDGERTEQVQFLVSAIGQLQEPNLPPIAGLDDREDFDGQWFHSARWPADLTPEDLAGKSVAIVGTGASSMQIVPNITDHAESVTIYQRSPQWARPIPRYHEPIPPGSQWLFERLPFYAEWFRFTMLWRYGDGLLPFLRKDPNWPHPDRSLNRINDRHRQEMTNHIHIELHDHPELIDQCLPDYPPYGKRILLDNGWYQALREPHVTLVSEAVHALEGPDVVDATGTRRPADIVVLATGFEVSAMAARLNVQGSHGQMLHDTWADNDPRAYLGISVAGFPNLFCMQGPNTGLGHGGSAIFQSECQARYITAMLAEMDAAGVQTAAVRPETQQAWVDATDAEHEQLIWTHPGMSTYYRNAAGRVVSVMPWRLVDYWAMTHDPDLADYDVQ